jgi:hypothetical protein
MNIAWVIAEKYLLPPSISTAALNDAAPTWASWRLWRTYNVDNTVCYQDEDAKQVINQGYHEVSNLYISEPAWQKLNKPPGVKCFGGVFPKSILQAEDVVSIHLAAAQNDLLLLLGFNLSDLNSVFYTGLIENSPQQQWVIVDGAVPSKLSTLPNLTCDTLQNVLQSLA